MKYRTDLNINIRFEILKNIGFLHWPSPHHPYGCQPYAICPAFMLIIGNRNQIIDYINQFQITPTNFDVKFQVMPDVEIERRIGIYHPSYGSFDHNSVFTATYYKLYTKVNHQWQEMSFETVERSTWINFIKYFQHTSQIISYLNQDIQWQILYSVLDGYSVVDKMEINGDLSILKKSEAVNVPDPKNILRISQIHFSTN